MFDIFDSVACAECYDAGCLIVGNVLDETGWRRVIRCPVCRLHATDLDAAKANYHEVRVVDGSQVQARSFQWDPELL